MSVAALLLATLAPVTVTAAAAPRHRPLQGVVDRWARSPALRGLEVGVAVVALDEGGERASHHGDALMNPASGTKLLTTAAVLATLPHQTRMTTRVLGDLADEGRLRGPLVLVGGGDPKLLPAHLERLAATVAAAGVRAIPEGVAVDGARFAPPMTPPAYDQKASPAGYRASIGAAGSNFGAVRVVVRPGRRVGGRPRVSVTPRSGALVVVNRASTVDGKDSGVGVRVEGLPDGRTRLVIGGAIGRRGKRFSERRRVADPDLLTAWLLRAALQSAGIEVGDSVRRSAPGAPRPGRELARLDSAPLASSLRDMNVWSNNSMAETLFKHLGAGPEGAPATWQRAQATATRALEGLGLAPGSFRIVNGSGLYDATHVTPRAMAKLLAALHADRELGPRFRETLAVSGGDGTMRRRLRGALAGKVHGKTGTLDEVVSLSGYVTARSGRELAFAIFVNGANPGLIAPLRRRIDRLVARLARL